MASNPGSANPAGGSGGGKAGGETGKKKNPFYPYRSETAQQQLNEVKALCEKLMKDGADLADIKKDLYSALHDLDDEMLIVEQMIRLANQAVQFQHETGSGDGAAAASPPSSPPVPPAAAESQAFIDEPSSTSERESPIPWSSDLWRQAMGLAETVNAAEKDDDE